MQWVTLPKTAKLQADCATTVASPDTSRRAVRSQGPLTVSNATPAVVSVSLLSSGLPVTGADMSIRPCEGRLPLGQGSIRSRRRSEVLPVRTIRSVRAVHRRLATLTLYSGHIARLCGTPAAARGGARGGFGGRPRVTANADGTPVKC